MPKEKYIITSNCRFDRRHYKKGTIIELDSDEKVDMDKIAMLNHAGRIGLATSANIKAIEAEIEAEKANEQRLAQQAAALSRRQQPVAA